MNDEQRKRDQEAFDKGIKEVAEKLPDHKIKEFTFTKAEQIMLAEQQTILTLANQTQEKIINEICLKRVGIEPNNQLNVQYAIALGRFVCFIPKEK